MNKNELGLGIAGFLLSLTTIMVLIKGNILSPEAVDAIIADSQSYLKTSGFLVGSRDTVLAAEEALRVAEQSFHRALESSKAS